MKNVKALLLQNYAKYNHFEYYQSIIEVIEQNAEKNPDIAIESCKSLIEGISKSILKNLDATYNGVEIDKLDFSPLCKRMLTKMSDHCEDIESDFINRACSFIHLIGEIRNKRGDISHGKLAPKEIYSSDKFATLVINTTDAIVYFILKQFYEIDLSYTEEIQFESNSDFNEWLDEINPIAQGLSYSKALFDQDNVSYFEQLKDYRAMPD